MGRDQRHQGIKRQLSSQNGLLLVATGEAGEGHLRSGGADVECLHLHLGRRVQRAALQQPEARETVELVEIHVLGHRHGRYAGHGMAILRHDATTGCRDGGGAGVRELDVADEVAAFRGRQQAGQHHAELALAVALDTGQPDDLAGPDFQGEIVEPRGAMAVLHGDAVADQREARLGRRLGLGLCRVS